jgi:hypothetical protein
MSGIQFVTDEKGRKVAVQIDLKNTGRCLRIFGTGWFRSRAARKKGIPLEKI